MLALLIERVSSRRAIGDESPGDKPADLPELPDATNLALPDSPLACAFEELDRWLFAMLRSLRSNAAVDAGNRLHCGAIAMGARS